MLKSLNLTPVTVNVFYYLHWFVLVYYLTFHFSAYGLLLSAVSYFLFGCLGVEVNAHRYFSHRTFRYRYKWMEYVFSWFTCLGGTGSPMQWAGIHFDHHQHSDRNGDPHNPKEKGVKMLFWLTYEKGSPLNLRHMISPYQKWLHRNYFKVYVITWAGLWALGGTWLVVYGAVIPTALVTAAQVLTTYLCHMDFGYRNYETDDDSRNIWWWALVDFGEGLHNTHHADPSRYHLKDRWYEVDISGIVIERLLRAREAGASTGH